MTEAVHATQEELEAKLADIRGAPKDGGGLALIVARPRATEREVLDEGTLDLHAGLVGDDWHARGSKKTDDGSAHPDMQIAIIGARAIAALAREQGRWALAGDQLYLDMDLSPENLPPGTRLGLGSAVIEITAMPHNGCKKFRERFGEAAIDFLASDAGRSLRLRGIYAKVVRPGVVRVGDTANKLSPVGSVSA